MAVSKTNDLTLKDIIKRGAFILLMLTPVIIASWNRPTVNLQHIKESPASIDDQVSKARTFIHLLAQPDSSLQTIDLNGVHAKTAVVYAAAGMIESIQESANDYPEKDKLKTSIASLRKELAGAQVMLFPKLRQAFARNLEKELWVNNVTVTVGGARNTAINFVAAEFASNANIQAFDDKIDTIAATLRFKHSIYRWYKGASEGIQYERKTYSDATIAVLRGVPVELPPLK